MGSKRLISRNLIQANASRCLVADSINFMHVDMSKVPKTVTLQDGSTIERLDHPSVTHVFDKNGDYHTTLVKHSRLILKSNENNQRTKG